MENQPHDRQKTSAKTENPLILIDEVCSIVTLWYTAEDSAFTGENLLKHPNHTDSLARCLTWNKHLCSRRVVHAARRCHILLRIDIRN